MEEREPMVRPNTHSHEKNAATPTAFSLDTLDEEQTCPVQSRQALPRDNPKREPVPKDRTSHNLVKTPRKVVATNTSIGVLNNRALQER